MVIELLVFPQSKPVFKETTWIVPNITKELFHRSELANRPIYSDCFKIFDGRNFSEWKIAFYPLYRATKDVGLFLTLVKSTSTSFKSNVMLSIHNLKTKSDVSSNFKRTGKEFHDGGGGYGFPSILKFAEFMQKFDEFVVDKQLTIVCRISILPKTSNNVLRLKNTRTENLTGFSAYLFENDYLSDFVIEAGEKTFNCHKLILASNSSVFDKMFESGMVEAKEGKCKISDFGPVIIKEMLRFMYCEEVKNLDAIARKLIYAAEKYEIDCLKKLCIESIVKNLSLDNVITAMIIADQISQAESLFHECMFILMNHYKIISQKQEFKNLPSDILIKISVSFNDAMVSNFVGTNSAQSNPYNVAYSPY